MLKKDLDFSYPPHLVATEKKPVSRVMLVEKGEPTEVTLSYLLTQIQPDDLLVINETRVIPARMHADNGMEILFIKNLEDNLWQVLCPARRWPKNSTVSLPEGVEMELVERGKPQILKANKSLDEAYFFRNGDIPLPPYIQEARGERRSRELDHSMYQTQWAQQVGSLAAPTASLHFRNEDLDRIRRRGATVQKICLHVGLGTFLPITSDNLEDHKMHSESVMIPKATWQSIKDCKKNGGRVWALGSTVTRALESMSLGMLQESENEFFGETDLFIKPGFEFKVVDVLMTNFHQPQSTLIAMVMAFAGVENLKKNYEWAIERQFRLFSYGDLTVWKN